MILKFLSSSVFFSFFFLLFFGGAGLYQSSWPSALCSSLNLFAASSVWQLQRWFVLWFRFSKEYVLSTLEWSLEKTLICVMLLEEARRRKVDIHSCMCVGLPFFATQWRCAGTLIKWVSFLKNEVHLWKDDGKQLGQPWKETCLFWSCSIFLLYSYWMPIKMCVLRCVFHMGGFCGVSWGCFLQAIWLLACWLVLCESCSY